MAKKHRSNKRRAKNLLFWIVLILLLAIFAGFVIQRKLKEDQYDQASAQSQAIYNIIKWNGKEYKYNTSLYNIVFLGIDDEDSIETYTYDRQDGQSNCIMLLSLDKEHQEVHILQINRNTMADVAVHKRFGHSSDNLNAQLALQYAYGGGGKNSCIAMRNAVSNLLGGIPIDGYFAINLEDLAEVNDALGGVNVQMAQDYSSIHPDFQNGKTIHMQGEQAEQFVRYRDAKESNSEADRMSRQLSYVTSMLTSMKGRGGRDLYDILKPYMRKTITADVELDQLKSLVNYKYLVDQAEQLPGNKSMEGEYEEYYVDEDALQEMIVQRFYEEKK